MFREYSNPDGLKIWLPDKIYDAIKKQVSKHYPNECGGIFVGRIDNNNLAVIEKMMMPRRFSSSPVLFVRVADFINKWLLRIFMQSDGQLIYLGEWHSHPNGRPHPSSTDHNSMKKIAANEDVKISTPLMLIVGYNKAEYNELFYIFYNQKLVPYEIES